MFPLDFLGVAFARMVLLVVAVALVRTPMIRIVARDPKGSQQSFQLQKHLLLAPATDIGQDLSRRVIKRMPQPSLLVLLADKAPHFINFRCRNAPKDNCRAWCRCGRGDPRPESD